MTGTRGSQSTQTGYILQLLDSKSVKVQLLAGSGLKHPTLVIKLLP